MTVESQQIVTAINEVAKAISDTSSLRDVFATAAMLGLLARGATPDEHDIRTIEDYISQRAYQYADAMIGARE